MSNTDEELLTTPSGCEDVAGKAVNLIKKPQALLNYFLSMQKSLSVSDQELMTLAFYLLPQLKLQRRVGTPYLDKQYAEAMFNSSAVNLTYEALPSRYQERFNDLNPFSGFKEFFARRDISLLESKRASLLLQNPPKNSLNNQVEVATFHTAIELLLEAAPYINDDLGLQKLSSYEEQRPK